MRKRIDLTGKRFGRLTVICYSHTANKYAWWECLCDCGVTKVILGDSLRRGYTRSCGCLQKEEVAKRSLVHGRGKTREWKIWNGMKQRCYNPNDKNYRYYGERGIVMDERWRNSFEEFFKDMGVCPPGLTLGRVRPDAPYSKETCRWETHTQQNRNKTDNVSITYKNKTQCLSAWAEELGIPDGTVRARFNRGWTIKRTFETPVDTRFKPKMYR